MAEPVLIEVRAIQSAAVPPHIARSLMPSKPDADLQFSRLPGTSPLQYSVSATPQAPY